MGRRSTGFRSSWPQAVGFESGPPCPPGELRPGASSAAGYLDQPVGFAASAPDVDFELLFRLRAQLLAASAASARAAAKSCSLARRAAASSNRPPVVPWATTAAASHGAAALTCAASARAAAMTSAAAASARAASRSSSRSRSAVVRVAAASSRARASACSAAAASASARRRAPATRPSASSRAPSSARASSASRSPSLRSRSWSSARSCESASPSCVLVNQRLDELEMTVDLRGVVAAPHPAERPLDDEHRQRLPARGHAIEFPGPAASPCRAGHGRDGGRSSDGLTIRRPRFPKGIAADISPAFDTRAACRRCTVPRHRRELLGWS